MFQVIPVNQAPQKSTSINSLISADSADASAASSGNKNFSLHVVVLLSHIFLIKKSQQKNFCAKTFVCVVLFIVCLGF